MTGGSNCSKPCFRIICLKVIDGAYPCDRVLDVGVLLGFIVLDQNADGVGGSWTTHVISTAADGARSVFAIDVDGDGDTDVLSASYYDDTVAWYENTQGDGSARSLHVITTQADGAWSVFAIDVNGNGNIDAL